MYRRSRAWLSSLDLASSDSATDDSGPFTCHVASCRRQRIAGENLRDPASVVPSAVDASSVLLHAIQLVQGQVELEDVDGRLAEEAKLPARRVRLDEPPHFCCWRAALPGDSRHLELCR